MRIMFGGEPIVDTEDPYKGTARYWTLDTPAGQHVDLAWSYPSPFRESAPIAGLIAFFDERIDLTVDGTLQPRPVSAPAH